MARDETVSSRDVTFAYLCQAEPLGLGLRWGANSAENDGFVDAGVAEVFDLVAQGASRGAKESFVFLSSAR